MMCFQGYTGRLCSNCIFPGTSPETAYGQYYSGCGLCPPWSTAMTAYVLSRVFDIAIYTRSKAGGSRRVINYSPASLTTGELFEVFKDFLQVLSILQVVLHGWQSAAAAAMSSLSITPLSTKAWISLDCILPRTQAVAVQRQMYNIAAQVLLPGNVRRQQQQQQRPPRVLCTPRVYRASKTHPTPSSEP
eukprot:gene14567-14696_t